MGQKMLLLLSIIIGTPAGIIYQAFSEPVRLKSFTTNARADNGYSEVFGKVHPRILCFGMPIAFITPMLRRILQSTR